MLRGIITLALIAIVSASPAISANGRIKQHGRAIVEYRSGEVLAVASYEYSQRNHDSAWLLIELAIQATQRIAIHRNELTLIGPDERTVPVATHAQFLEDQPILTGLLQNARVWRRPLDPYFASRPTTPTIRFFSTPGGAISDSVVTNLDQVAAGDVLFRSLDGKWNAGPYRLILNHEKAKAELPISLK